MIFAASSIMLKSGGDKCATKRRPGAAVWLIEIKERPPGRSLIVKKENVKNFTSQKAVKSPHYIGAGQNKKCDSCPGSCHIFADSFHILTAACRC